MEHFKEHPFCIEGNPIEFDASFAHLGHIINVDLTDDDDILKRRTDFIGQTNMLLCYFHNLDRFSQ